MVATYTYKELLDKNIIPDDCDRFYCNNCNLSKLQKLPDRLRLLLCNNNVITELPALPDILIELNCGSNQITELPELPNGLKYLNCCNNRLMELPELPNGLKLIYCHINPIRFITPQNYKILKKIYLKDKSVVYMANTIFYDNSGCSSNEEFFGYE
jgi:hypothetical protein